MVQKKNIEVKVGEKVEEKGDPSKGKKDSATPSSGEVGGRIHDELVQCPWCGSIRYVTVLESQYLWYTCGNCGRSYRA
jgi:transcription elongation factor Elf1